MDSLDTSMEGKESIKIIVEGLPKPGKESLEGVEQLQYGLTAEQIPDWLRFANLKIGYRMGGSYWSCLASLFRVHNMTLNAWTMIVPSLLSVAAMTWVLVHEQPGGADVLPFVALCVSALVHLPFSVGYHLFMPISPEVYNQWRKLDVAFIFVASIFLTFSLDYFIMPAWATALNTGIAGLVTAAALKRIIALKLGEALNRLQQSAFIGMIVLVYYAPIAYQAVQDHMDGRGYTVAHTAAIVVLVSLTLGGWVYADGFPERAYPARFDIVGSSHQLMHVGVGAAHAAEFFFVLGMYRRQS